MVQLKDPNDANRLGIGMVHQHFKLVHNFTVLENIILGVESTQGGFLKMDKAREKVMALSERYGFRVDPDALISDISVGMQQRVEILKMLYRENEILIFRRAHSGADAAGNRRADEDHEGACQRGEEHPVHHV